MKLNDPTATSEFPTCLFLDCREILILIDYTRASLAVAARRRQCIKLAIHFLKGLRSFQSHFLMTTWNCILINPLQNQNFKKTPFWTWRWQRSFNSLIPFGIFLRIASRHGESTNTLQPNKFTLSHSLFLLTRTSLYNYHYIVYYAMSYSEYTFFLPASWTLCSLDVEGKLEMHLFLAGPDDMSWRSTLLSDQIGAHCYFSFGYKITSFALAFLIDNLLPSIFLCQDATCFPAPRFLLHLSTFNRVIAMPLFWMNVRISFQKRVDDWLI